jgi:hypothetical protein
MSRPWTLEGLLAARVLAAANVPLINIGVELDRSRGEIDLALYALLGRTPEDALARLNGGELARAAPPPARLLSLLRQERLTLRQICSLFDAEEGLVERSLRDLAFAGLVDCDEPEEPCTAADVAWWAVRRAEASS